MSVTVSTLISDAQTLIDDSVNPTFTQMLRFLNRARQTLARDVPWYEKEASYSSLTSTYQYSLPSDCIKVKTVEFRDVDNWYRIEPLTEREWKEIDLMSESTKYTNYFEQNYVLNMTPRLKAETNTTTLAADLTIGETGSASLVSTASLPSTGQVLIGSEIIYYTSKDDTANTISTLSRAQKGTTAAAHTSGDTVTELSSGANITTITANMTNSQTFCKVEDSTILPTVGKITIGTEIIYYNGKNDTIGLLDNLVRAQEGSTAATHTSGDTVTERDIVITYFAVPTDLSSGAVDQAFNVNPDVLVYFMAWQAKMKDTDDTNPSADRQMQYFQQQYLKAVAEMKYNLRSRKDGPVKVQEVI